jgi:hypothetical protein
MKWWEFTQDNGDGSYSKCRFKSKQEAEDALEYLENNVSFWVGDGEGVQEVDTESSYFWDSLEDIATKYS